MAKALEATRAIFFYGTWLRERCEEDHDLGYELVKRTALVMMHRLEATQQRLVDHLGGTSVDFTTKKTGPPSTGT